LKLHNHEFYNCTVYLTDQQSFLMEANWLHNNLVDSWQGWQCHAGYDRLFLDSDGNLYSGDCRNDHLGHVDQDWKLFDQPTICWQEQCTGCVEDLLVTKQNVV